GYLNDIIRTFRNYKALGDAALSQIPDASLHDAIDPDSNSAAVIVKHIGGNFRSRFTDFLTTDGDKPDRDRDAEFEILNRPTRAEILRWWETGWTAAFTALESLKPEDLTREVTIRSEPLTVVEALNRSATHVAYHVGQLVLLARHIAGAAW